MTTDRHLAASGVHTSYSILEESIYAETPSTGTPNQIFVKSEDIGLDTGVVASEQISGKGNTTQLRKTKEMTAGSIDVDFSLTQYNLLLESALRAKFEALPTAAVTVSFLTPIVAPSVVTDYATRFLTVNPDAQGESTQELFWNAVRQGQAINITNAGVAGNNGIYLVDRKYIQSVAGTEYRILLLSAPVSVEADREVTITGSSLMNGRDVVSFSLEKHFRDIASYHGYTGLLVDTAAFTFAPEALVEANFDLMGSGEVRSKGQNATSIFGSRLPTPASNELIATGQESLREAVVSIAGVDQELSTISLNIANGLRARNNLGTLTPFSYGPGMQPITGDLTGFFTADSELYETYANGRTPFAIRMEIREGNDNLFIYIPNCYFTTGSVPNPGPDGEIFDTMGWQATLDNDLGNGNGDDIGGGQIVVSRITTQ